MAAPLPPRLIERVEALLARGGRLLGIAGAPGAGKSTVSAGLIEHFGARAQLLPLDGFHLANEELERRGLAHRKGAPETFDVDGYLDALARVHRRDHDVLVPRFHREIEEPIAGSLCIRPSTELVITEGNYLLLRSGRWTEVTAMLDERWLLTTARAVRVDRLLARHEAHGRTPMEAQAWIAAVDEPNARLIDSKSAPADLVVPWD